MNVALNIKDYFKKEKGKKKIQKQRANIQAREQSIRTHISIVCLLGGFFTTFFSNKEKKKKASNRGNRLFCVISPHGTAFSMFHHWRRPLPVFAIVSHSLSFQPFRLYLVRYFLPHQSPLPPSTSCSNFLGY